MEKLIDLVKIYGQSIISFGDNLNYPAKNILYGTGQCITNSDDGKLIINITFSQSVTIRSYKIKAPYGGNGPRVIKFFVNVDEFWKTTNVTFENVKPKVLGEFENSSKKLNPTETVTLSPEQLTTQWPSVEFKSPKFKSVTSLTIFIEDNQGHLDCTVIDNLSFWGFPCTDELKDVENTKIFQNIFPNHFKEIACYGLPHERKHTDVFAGNPIYTNTSCHLIINVDFNKRLHLTSITVSAPAKTGPKQLLFFTDSDKHITNFGEAEEKTPTQRYTIKSSHPNEKTNICSIDLTGPKYKSVSRFSVYVANNQNDTDCTEINHIIIIGYPV